MKTFSLHWGSGVVEEEAQIETPYHRPTIQLLKFTDGKAKGSYEIRFCTYDHRGRFQRMPLRQQRALISSLQPASVTPLPIGKPARVKLSSRGPILLPLLNFSLHHSEFTPVLY